MELFSITHPTALVAREIEDLVVIGKNSKNLIVNGGCALASRAISLTIFPIFLGLELIFKRIPKLILSIGDQENFSKKADKVLKYVLGLLFFPLGIHSPEGISGFFLKMPPTAAVRPFGVEYQYGKEVDRILLPKSVNELQRMVLRAKLEKKQVSILGAGMSQGTQTVPKDSRQVVIDTRHLNKITIAKDGKTVSVQSGATWEAVQLELNRHRKSTIVKQASDPFSIGGSIGINCHGWAHEAGAISSTVAALEIIDAQGCFRKITPKDELFRCMFGTLGYFGVIVSADLKITDNDFMIEKTEEIDVDEFGEYYNTKIKDKGFPLFGGRLVLDNLDGDPLRKICMVRYEPEAPSSQTGDLVPELKTGTRIQRIGLKLMSHLSNYSVKRLTQWFWNQERAQMFEGRRLTRNEALHPPINAFKMLHHSKLHAQWLQEYFIKEKNLPNFLRFLGAELKANDVRLINATIRPTPRDSISILPYAEQDRHAVVICFSQEKTEASIENTRKWIDNVNRYLISQGDIYYQAYMPFATRRQFEQCYGEKTVNKMRALKQKYDPDNLFGNAHTVKYYDRVEK